MTDLPKVSFRFNNQGSFIEVTAYAFDGDPIKKFSSHQYTSAPGWFGRIILRETWESRIEDAKQYTMAQVMNDVIQYRKSQTIVEAQYNG